MAARDWTGGNACDGSACRHEFKPKCGSTIAPFADRRSRTASLRSLAVPCRVRGVCQACRANRRLEGLRSEKARSEAEKVAKAQVEQARIEVEEEAAERARIGAEKTAKLKAEQARMEDEEKAADKAKIEAEKAT